MISAELGLALEKVVTRLAALDTAIARGLDDAKSGRSKPAEDVFARLQAKYTVPGKAE